MKTTELASRKVKVKRSQENLYAIFSDLTNFDRNVPTNLLEKVELQVTEKTLLTKVAGFELGIKICQMEPYCCITYRDYGSSPFEFTVSVNIESLGPEESEVQLELKAKIPGIYKMMLGGKIQQGLDQITDQLAKM